MQLDSVTETAPEWKREVNNRLAAHRTRRGGFAQAQPALPGMEFASPEKQSARPKTIAERVAARYAQAPTYSEMLAAEAQNAARAAQAAATAAQEAHAAAQAILVGLDMPQTEASAAQLEQQTEQPPEPREIYRANIPEHLKVRSQSPAPESRSNPVTSPYPEEICDPFADALVTPVQPLPAKLLEFPRELIAARKARPRLAEGPLREDPAHSSEKPQLRIFEVEPEAISTQPAVAPVLSGWSSIRLDARPDSQYAAGSDSPDRQSVERKLPVSPVEQPLASAFDLPLQTASLEDRLMAGIVDIGIVVLGFLLFLLVFSACTAHLPAGKPALLGAAAVLFAFFLLYQFLFFSYGQDTPGMRYAKIGLCTFGDENPTRKVMRRRIGALLLSACPMGLGLLWAFFDDDRLGWHDRISRTYQRSYR